MTFEKEPAGYQKTALSDLQGAWEGLRAEVTSAGFPGWQAALFHIDEAMSWESVRNLQYMHSRLVLIRNLLPADQVPEAVTESVALVNAAMEETVHALRDGEID